MSIDPVSLAITAALTAAQMAVNMTRKIEGPRTEDLNVTVADYGTPLNYFYGTRRFGGVVIFFAEQIRETKKRRKTKGGKVNEYKYFGTWAFVVADHQIDAVTRMWFDKHLVFDATGVGPISALEGGDISSHMRVYLGTETQEADPRMQATIEALHGAGSCPAYRGVAYVMLEELPLEKFGNRIPQQSVEATSNATGSLPYESVDSVGTGSNWHFAISPSGQWMAYVTNGDTNIEWWSIPTRTRLGSSAGGTIANSVDAVGITDDGTVYYMGPRFSGLDVFYNFYSVSPLGSFVRGPDLDSTKKYGYITRAFGSGGTAQVFTNWGGLFDPDTPGYFSSGQFIEMGSCARDFFQDSDGDVWGIFQPDGASDTFSLYNLTHGSAIHHFTANTSRGDISACRGCATAAGNFFVTMDGFFYVIDPDTMTITDSGVNTWGSPLEPGLPFNRPGAASFWVGFGEYSLTDGSLIRTVDPLDWVFEDSDQTGYDFVNHAIISRPQFDDWLTWRYLDRVSGGGVTLGTIVGDVCDRSNIAATNYDVTALTQTVLGFGWTQASGKSITEPLLDVYDSLCRPHDFKVQFIKRAGASTGNIDVAEFASEDPRYKITIAQDTDLPRGIALSFADPDADQQPNTVIAQRPLDSVDGVRQASLDMTTLVLDKDEARQLAERWFRRTWNSRETYSHGLTAQKMALEPGDVQTLGLDSVSRTAELQRLTFRADDSLAVEWRRDFSSLAAVSSTLVGAAQDGRVPSVLLVPMVSKAFAIDTPLLNDTDNSTSPLLYMGAAPYAEEGFWPGAVLYQQEGDDYDLEVGAVDSTSASTWGSTTTTLASATHYVWDRGNTVGVNVRNGSLTSTTEADCNANPRLNRALLGYEVIQFTTATLTGTDNGGRQYTLSGLKRGRRGTEQAVDDHATGEVFLMLDQVAPVEMSAGDIGEDMSFKAATFGMDVDTAAAESVTDYQAASHRPWAPGYNRGIRNPSTGDWDIYFQRRSRVAGDFAPGNPPLGESVESYKLKIYNGASVVRTITGASSSPMTYTAAQQTTDFGSPQSTISVGMLQVGDLADGYETTATYS